MPRLLRSLLHVALVASVASCGAGDQAAPPARVAGMELAQQQLQLGDFQRVHGTGYLFAPLVSERSYASYDSNRSGHAKNLLFFDVKTKAAHWLLGDETRRLRFYALIEDPPVPQYWLHGAEDEDRRRALAVLFESIPDPGGGSPALNPKGSIGIAAPDGTEPTILLENVSGLLGHHLIGEHSLIVFYNRDGELWAADIAPETRSITSDTRVSAAGSGGTTQ